MKVGLSDERERPEGSATVPGAVPRTTALPAPRRRLLAGARRPVGWLLRRWCGVQVYGHEHVRRAGPVILAANHTYFLDGPVLVASAARDTVALAKSELFTGVRGWALGQLGEIAIDRRSPAPTALGRCIAVLREGRALAVFPEGRRSLTSPDVTYGGWAYLALVTGAPVVPVAILRSRAGMRPRFTVVFGEPVTLPSQPWPRRPGEIAAAHRRLRACFTDHLHRAAGIAGIPLPGAAHV